MDDAILVLNAGSSSVKFALYLVRPDGLARDIRGEASGLGATPRLRIAREASVLQDAELPADADQASAVAAILGWLDANSEARVVAVGHRVVHGGQRYAAPVRLDRAVLAELESFSPLAPLHQPHNLGPIRTLMDSRPELPQVACFDTAFHRTQPAVAQRFALPAEYAQQGVLRYGFHGLSYEYIAQALGQHDPAAAKGRVVVAHLGAGASLCALREGSSIATSMGFTALDGLPMGTRCGNLDPGVVLYLLQQRGMSPAQVEELLYKRSGLLGMSGVSGDMRQVLAAGTAAAREAVEVFVYRAQREIGSLVAALGGLDGLVFTAGIGEHSAVIRAWICAGLGWLGLALDDAANERHRPRISRDDSRVGAWVIPTDEELMIARHTWRLLSA